MTRGVLPVVVLLVIASAFSQFSGPSGLMLSTAGTAVQVSSTPGVPQSSKPGPNNLKSADKNPDCKELNPCIPRSDLGPWYASCEFARVSADPDRSPETVLDATSPVKNRISSLAASNTAFGDSPADPWCLDQGLRINPPQIVIVTLPDPVRSHLALDFDRRVDAIQSAALEAGFVPDHFWLPWTGIRTNPSENPDLKSADRVLQELRLSQPGLEIFRSKPAADRDRNADPDKKSDLLFVFLVGENPTTGIDLGQLDKAREYASEINKATHASGDQRLKLLTPCFSGSIPALVDYLKTKSNHPGADFDIVTSSATDHNLLASLATAVPGSVRAVLHDDYIAMRAIQEFAQQNLDLAPSDIAVISETETAYGAAAPADTTLNTRKLTFPREIYRLRTIYPDSQPVSAGAHPEKVPTAGLDFNLKMSPGGEDGIPAFSADELPLSQEAELLSVAETIHRDKIKLVGVLATDVFDTLFVLRFLHEYCPDTRLFVVDSDVLFVRAASNYSLEGTLVVTNYRLATARFPSRYSEATFNAFLALIGRTDKLTEYQLETSKVGGQGSQPPLWLAVLSTNGMQPVHAFPEIGSKSLIKNALPLVSQTSSPTLQREQHESALGTEPAPEIRRSPDVHFPSGANLALAYLLFSITVAQILCAWAGFQSNIKFLNWLIEFFHVSRYADAQKSCFISISFFVLVVFNIFVFFPIWRVANLAESGSNNHLYTLLAVFGAIAAFGSFCMSAAFFIRHQVVWTKTERMVAGLCITLLLAYLIAWLSCCWLSPDAGFILQRSLDLSNGVSPLTPHLLILIVLYLWSLAHVRRIHLWETRRLSISFTSLDETYKSQFQELGADLDHDFRTLTPGMSALVIIVAILLTGILISARPLEHLASFESALPVWKMKLRVFDSLYLTYVCCCATLLGFALTRFILGWSALLKVLRRLERQPIRHAFDRLPKKFYSWTPLWHSGGTRKSLAIQTRALETFEKLWSYRNAPGFPTPAKMEIENNMGALRNATASLLRSESEGKLDTSAENGHCAGLFLSVADNLTRDLLIPHWESVGNCESVEQHEKDQAEKPDKGVRHVFQEKHPPLNPSDFIVVAEEFVALRFVAFMRYVGVQLRNMLSFVIAGFILCVASVRSYPFLAHRTIGWGLTVVFFVIGIPVVIAFAQMDKDAILSRLSDTDPGKLDRAFYVRLIAYGGLPFLTVLASQFPAIGRFLFSWIQPAIEALH